MTTLWTLPIMLLAGIGGGLLALRTGIPAAPLAGALLAAGALGLSGRLEPVGWPPGTPTPTPAYYSYFIRHSQLEYNNTCNDNH